MLTSPAKGDISRNSNVVQLQQVRDGTKPGEECGDLFEVVVAQLYQGGGGKHSLKKDSLQMFNKMKLYSSTFGDIMRAPWSRL